MWRVLQQLTLINYTSHQSDSIWLISPVGEYKNVPGGEVSCLPGAVKPGKIVLVIISLLILEGRREGHPLLLDLCGVLSEPAGAGDIFSLEVAVPVSLLGKQA